MRAGHLRHRLTFETKSTAQDSFGGEQDVWSASFEVWGSVQPLRGREFLESDQQQAAVSHKVRIRYRAGVVPTMRIKVVLDSRDPFYLQINDVIEPFVKGSEIELMCTEFVEN